MARHVAQGFSPANPRRFAALKRCATKLRRRSIAVWVAMVGVAWSATLVGEQSPPPQTPLFRSRINLVLVDVIVRDKSGAVVKGLTADDFDVLEDGQPQRVVSFAYDEISTSAAPIQNVN